jgi:hypothetical protein
MVSPTIDSFSKSDECEGEPRLREVVTVGVDDGGEVVEMLVMVAVSELTPLDEVDFRVVAISVSLELKLVVRRAMVCTRGNSLRHCRRR